MTSTIAPRTARDLLAPEGERQEVNRKLGKALTAAGALAVVASLKEWKTAISVPKLIEDIAVQFHDLLRIDFSEVASRGWNKSREVVQKMAETREDGSLKYVDLLDHSIHSVHHPKIEIVVDGHVRHTLEFDLEIELRLQGARIGVKVGRVTTVMGGQVDAKGIVKFKDFVLAEKAFEPVTIY